MSIAYLSNRFPEPLESYVGEEISELRKRGCTVFPCSVQWPVAFSWPQAKSAIETLYVFPLNFMACFKAIWLCITKFSLIADLVWRALRGPEAISRRCRTIVHTWLGTYLAVLLKKERIRHLHIHHGYFASWVGMVAARFLDASFSMTLHGSDLLLRADYLDVKLKHCRFCITVSDFNRLYIAGRFPQIDPGKILVQRLGVDPVCWRPRNHNHGGKTFSMLSVGRLHPTKNHGFLLLACAALRARGVPFRCVIAGEGEERGRLEQLIRELNLRQEVTLLGHVPRERLPELYAEADVVVLTSRSEGLPVTLMEAMAMERVVLAPRITGIPELVTHGVNGFLYTQNSMEDFLAKLQSIRAASQSLDLDLDLDAVRQAARREVDLYFNSRVNLAGFAECFLKHAGGFVESALELPRKETHENPVLQQVQLHVQRDRSLPV
jgi:colanic acid/amylovoran biosynthesis glycosyltransferase